MLENLQIAQERLDWSEKLYKQGFETKANLDKDRLTVSQDQLKLEQAEKALWMVETFDNPKKKRSLEATLAGGQGEPRPRQASGGTQAGPIHGRRGDARRRRWN